MRPNEITRQPLRFDHPRQERVHRRLLLVGPGPAAFYRDACRLMAGESSYETASHLVAHLLRDIDSALCAVLETLADRSDRLSKEEKLSHKQKILVLLKALGIPETDPTAQAWLDLARQKNQPGLHARAHRNALQRPRPIDQEFRRFWDRMQAIFDIVLERFESSYFGYFPLLDQLLGNPSPTQEDVKVLRNDVPNNLITFGYFFDRLTSPVWLDLLRRGGFFKHPPEPESDESAETIRFPAWPESGYLARMAFHFPEEVLEIALQIPDTENVRVHGDLADAALAMPADLSARLVPKAMRWLTYPHQFDLPEKLAELMARLARGDQVSEALDLARALFSGEQPSRFNSWQYERIMRDHFPPLVDATGNSALVLLCDLLEASLDVSRPEDTGKWAHEHSYIWRPAIEDHSQNHQPPDRKNLLVSAVRDAAETVIQTKGKAVLQTVEGFPFDVFQRVGLHLRRCYPDVDKQGTARRVVDCKVFDNNQLLHEYFHLLKERFLELPEWTKEEYLDLVEHAERGSDLEQWLDLREQQTGGPPGNEEDEEAIRHWQYEKVWPIQDFLDEDWRKRFEHLKKEFGPLRHPDFHMYWETRSWIGPKSPVNVETLRAKSVEELVQFLEEWQPQEGMMKPSREGLSRMLTDVVASKPDDYSANARDFAKLDPIYVNGFLSGFRDALRQNVLFRWESVLGLCQCVVDQPRNVPGRGPEGVDIDHESGRTRRTIAELLSLGFEIEQGRIQFDLRDKAWRVLTPLTKDPDPTPQYEASMDGSRLDPSGLSINTVRGEAMHAVIRYALWVQRHIQERSEVGERANGGFQEMPEVREVLDHHLAQNADPSLAIRAVYGQWFPLLVRLDPSWAAQNVARVFPREHKGMHDAAWNAYIVFCGAYDEVFELLKEEYAQAIERVRDEDVPADEQRFPDPDKRLAEHLMELYWRGNLDSEETRPLLLRFYEKAPPALRGHAVDTVGRCLHATKTGVRAETIERLKRLWESRVETVDTCPANAPEAAEFAPFGWWFISAKFDDDWSLEQLQNALKRAQHVDPDSLVVEQLASLAAEAPLAVVECLRLIAEGAKETWQIGSWLEHGKSVLKTVLKSPDDNARRLAEALVNQLGARGYIGLRELLPGPGGP